MTHPAASYFNGRTIVIATMHGKERAIAPVLENALGVTCIIPELFNTDTFGTFSGEIERTESAYHTALQKCKLAMQLSGCDLAIANEGSFGAHPSIPFVHADHEIVVLLDAQNNLEIAAAEISTTTNFSGKEIRTADELLAFAAEAKFPSHGLILKAGQDDLRGLQKGIIQKDELLIHFQNILNAYGTCYAETDMRAHLNPMRMEVIKSATFKLIEKLGELCPECGTPGLDVTEVVPGLPCELCESPTRSTLSYVYQCKRCSYSRQQLYPHGKQNESARFCDVCNP